MRTFFAKAKNPFNTRVSPGRDGPPPDGSPTQFAAHKVAHLGLKPKYTVPPVLHPSPYGHIALLATSQGLLIRPHDGLTHPGTHVTLRWGKNTTVEELDGSGDRHDADWTHAVIVYGIIGILELFSGPYMLVISAREVAGNLLESTHTVFRVKGVVAIPLNDERPARVALESLASRNMALSRLSLLPSAAETLPFLVDHTSSHAMTSSQHSPRVQFSSIDQVKQMTPNETETFVLPLEGDRSASPTPSSTSVASSDSSTIFSPIANTLADRLSFWSRLSKRSASLKLPSVEDKTTSMAEDDPFPPSRPLDPNAIDEMIQHGQGEPHEVINSIISSTAPPPISSEEKHSELEAKVIKECIREYTKGGMYFAYNFDITRSLQHKQSLLDKTQKQESLLVDLNAIPLPDPNSTVQVALAEPSPTLPLWRRVDKQFWWNEWLAKPFVDAGLHSYVLPIMQGYYQSSSFPLPMEPAAVSPDGRDYTNVEYIIISRRSRHRAGLRYQRRGIDDSAHVANFVETETVMRVEREGTCNVFSYVQIRGSIPLYWSQSGYALKPPPVLASDRTREQQMDALQRHFLRTISQYGPHTIVNLAERQGKEAIITRSYKEYVTKLGSKDTRYCEYDFHHETKGMKYEKISSLVEDMERTFDQQGFFWISGETILSQQTGVFRVNCIDCLDRTNVVQSAFARHVLNKQLSAVALLNRSSTDVRSEVNLIFNDVWANNGDAISRAYAGTSALKGDFTRTGKRDLGGMLNDGVNSLARMYTSTFSDWFSQAVIDFMLGNRAVSVFSEFLLKLQSTDPRDLIRLSKIRAEAIATATSRVLAEDERLISGWTLFAPDGFNVKISDKFEEKVLLLTKRALYVVSYDYSLEKVKMYTRVPLGDIICIAKGAYILSPLEEASQDPLQNAGFTVSWLNTPSQTTRVSSYSMRNSADFPTPPSQPRDSHPALTSSSHRGRPSIISSLTRRGSQLSKILTEASLLASSEKTFAAFKVLPMDHNRVRHGSTLGSTYAEVADEITGASNCMQAADMIVSTICQACQDVGNHHSQLVVEQDIVSLVEAQRMTSMYAKMEYGLKRLLWLGG